MVLVVGLLIVILYFCNGRGRDLLSGNVEDVTGCKLFDLLLCRKKKKEIDETKFLYPV